MKKSTAKTSTDDSRPSRRAWLAAIGVSLASMVLSLFLTRYLPANTLLLIPVLAVIVAAYQGGLGPGLLATGLYAVPGTLMLLASHVDNRPGKISQLLSFVFLGCVFSVLCDRRGPSLARIEEERKRAQENAEAAHNAEQQLHFLLNGIKDYAIAMLDTQGRITSWNAGGESIQGWQRDEIVGQPFSALYRPEDREAAHPERVLGTALREGRCEEQGQLIRKDGTTFPAHTVVSSVFDEAGHLRGFTLVASDITERRRMAEEKRRMEQEAVEAALKQRAFLKDVLNSVTEGRLRLCDTDADLPESLPLAAEPVPLSAPTLKDFRQQVQEVALRQGFAPERMGDLLTAAGEASMNSVVHAGGGEARVHADAETVQVWIQDRGTGIEMGYLHRATLERGYTTAGSMGHGFWLMLQTSDRVYLLTGPSGTTVVVEQAATPPTDPTWFGTTF